jgi:hypothetical protein
LRITAITAITAIDYELRARDKIISLINNNKNIYVNLKTFAFLAVLAVKTAKHKAVSGRMKQQENSKSYKKQQEFIQNCKPTPKKEHRLSYLRVLSDFATLLSASHRKRHCWRF